MKTFTHYFKIFLFGILFLSCGVYAAAGQTLSVLYFESLDRQDEFLWMEKGIADTLISELSGIEGLVLVEREQLQKVIDEMRLQLSGLTDESTASQFGLLLNADRLVTGSFSVQRGVLRINCRAMETETGKVLFSLSEQGEVDAFSELQQRLAYGIAQKLGLEKSVPVMQPESPSLKALAWYYEGLEYYDQKNYSLAAQLMEKSKQESPGFSKPGRTLEECYRFLNDFRQARQLRELNKLYDELDMLFARLNRRPFLTYGDVISRAAAAGEDISKLNEKLKEDISWFRGDTPAQVFWNAQILMFQIAQKYQNELSDSGAAETQYRRIIDSAEKAPEIFGEDPFMPEIIYQKILAFYMLQEWPALEKACFDFMNKWPDFRMISAVEDFYERSIEKRAGG